jgi:D-lactate dehydrogenase
VVVETITLGPGLIGAEANRRLARFGRKIGPDPASIDTAMIGGIAANNASGMCCGNAQNSYHSLAAHAPINQWPSVSGTNSV